MHCRVVRDFGVEPRRFTAQQVVDTTGWPYRNVQGLISQRFLEPLPTVEAVQMPATPEKAKRDKE